MKHLKILLPLFVFSFLVSCSRTNEDQFTLTDAEKSKIEGIIENSLRGELFSKTGRHLPVKIEKSFLKEIDGTMYLVSIYGEYKSTSLLDKNEATMEYEYAGITCTSSACSGNDGCVPNSRTSCSPCGRLDVGDCTKSITRLELK